MLTNLDESLEFFKREKGKGGREVRGKNEESMKQVRWGGERGEGGREGEGVYTLHKKGQTQVDFVRKRLRRERYFCYGTERKHTNLSIQTSLPTNLLLPSLRNVGCSGYVLNKRRSFNRIERCEGEDRQVQE